MLEKNVTENCRAIKFLSIMSIISIGWDVRGWRGKQQAVAVLEIKRSKLHWSVSDDFQFEPGSTLDLSSLLMPALGEQYSQRLDNANQVVLAIDAPLAFPQALTRLLTDSNAVFEVASSEISNPLAYRDCERWIYKQYGKKPLSASFDKLGNGATLAISMAHALKRSGFELMPQYRGNTTRSIIEVYPGLHKMQHRRNALAIPPLHRHIPEDIMPGTDQYDAAICAILGAVYAGCGSQLGLPGLVDLQQGYDPQSGWVYSLPVEFVQAHNAL